MKFKAQSLMEFAVILMAVTIVAIISLQIISNNINTSSQEEITIEEEEEPPAEVSAEESNCTRMGLSWDKKNGVCEAK